jgi:eukaryotic-like serine/threonine-protein kinase
VPLTITTRLGPYEVLELLGVGGMSEVYRARDTRLDRNVAIKVLAASAFVDPRRLDRLQREARAISRLNHPHVCALLDVGEQDGLPFLVMELLEGRTLADELLKGPLPVDRAIAFGLQIAQALDAAHTRGVIHRDLKPSNVMITKDGLKLLDFGIAKLHEPDESPDTRNTTRGVGPTDEGAVLGTYPYMSPEQLQGREADARSDIFALGVVLYEMATGNRPFRADNRAALTAAILTETPPLVSTLCAASPLLDRVIARCLEKNPEARWQSARDLASALRWAMEGDGSNAGHAIERSEPETRPGLESQTPVRRTVRWPLRLAGVLVLVLAAAATFGILWRVKTELVDPRIIAVTALPGLEQAPSISPDGNFVAFSWTGPSPEGVPDIWIKAVDSDARRQLTNTPAAEGRPAWSPDGREIAFLRGGQGVFIASALGGQERKVADTGSMVGWTPDGQTLLVRDRAKGSSDPFGIVGIELKTGQRRQITRAPTGIGDWTFSVSPDGLTLAFVRYERPGVGDVYVVPMAGGQARRRTNWNAGISRVAWMPDGRDVVYSVLEPPGIDPNLFRIRADGERLERGARALHVPVDGPSISALRQDGSTRLAFTRARSDVGLRLVDLQTLSAGGGFAESRFSDSTRVDFPGRFSRSGEQIAFLSDRNGSAEAWVSNLDGTGLRQVTGLQAPELMIGGWSPDDRRIVVDAAIAGNSDVYIVNLDGAPPVRLTKEASFDFKPEWSADGRSIYFTSDRSGTFEIWKVSVDGGPASQITRHGGAEPREAPDGRTLFYLDHPPPGAGGVSGKSTLKQVPVDGGEENVVLEGVRFGLWSVTDRGIAFLTIEPDSDAIDFYSFGDRRVRRQGGLPIRVSRIAGLGGLVVRRDTRWALISVTDQWESDIMMADGFR